MTTRKQIRPVRLKAPKPEALVPVFRFDDSMFIYKLTKVERKELHVPKDNPGVVVVVN